MLEDSTLNPLVQWLNEWFGENSWLADFYFQALWLIGTFVILRVLGKSHPSRVCFLFLLFPTVCFLLGAFGVDMRWLSWVFNPLLCIFLLVDRFLLAPSPDSVQITRGFHNKFSIQNLNAVELHLQNNSNHTLAGEIIDAIPEGFKSTPELLKYAIEPSSEKTLQYQVAPHKRGPHIFGKIHVRYKSPLGLLWINAQYGQAQSVDVYPNMHLIRKLRLKYSKAFALGELQKRKLGAEGTQFDSLRNYFPGDDVRKLAWQATARMDTPVVRVYTHEVEQPIVVLVDAGRKMMGTLEAEGNVTNKFDHALNAALAFACVAIERGDDVSARVFHQDIITEVPLGRGQKHFQKLLGALAHVQPQAVEPDYEYALLETARKLTKRSLIVLFTDLIDPLTSKTLVQSLSTLAKQHVVIVATWQDETIVAQSKEVPNTVDDVYQQGVRLDILDVRNKTLRELSSHGNISVIDATPTTLDERVINHYVSLKLKNRV